MVTIRVPRVPKAAFDPMRPASDLIKTQIRQLQVAILDAVDTEGEAARCIAVLTRLLREVRPKLVPVRYGAPRRKASSRRRKARAKR